MTPAEWVHIVLTASGPQLPEYVQDSLASPVDIAPSMAVRRVDGTYGPHFQDAALPDDLDAVALLRSLPRVLPREVSLTAILAPRLIADIKADARTRNEPPPWRAHDQIGGRYGVLECHSPPVWVVPSDGEGSPNRLVLAWGRTSPGAVVPRPDVQARVGHQCMDFTCPCGQEDCDAHLGGRVAFAPHWRIDQILRDHTDALASKPLPAGWWCSPAGQVFCPEHAPAIPTLEVQ